MNYSENELELLRDFRTGATTDTADARERARALLRNRMAAAPDRRSRRLVLRGGFPLAIGAAALAVAIALNPWAGADHDAHAAAAARLNAMAEAVTARPSTAGPLADGEFIYTRSESAWITAAASTDGRTAMALVPRTREIWIGADGSGRIHETITGEPVWLGEPDPDLAESIAHETPLDRTFGPGELATTDSVFGLTPERIAELTADPEALATMIRERAEQADPPPDYESFVIVGDLLREASLPPEFRAALYRYAATIPGVVLVGDVTDSAGRPGVAVAQEYRGVRHELVFDPETAQLLEERDVVVSHDSDYSAEPGAVVGRATYLASGIVTSTAETP